MELYGAVRGVVTDTIAPSVVAEERAVRRQRAMARLVASRIAPGMRVGR